MIKIADIFSDNMVLQREETIRIFGECDSPCKIKVELCENKTEISAQPGKWVAELSPMPAGGPYKLRVSSQEQSVVLENVLIGDVWIASGQSNMEFPLLFDIRGVEEAEKAFNNNIRFCTCRRATVPEKEKMVWAFEKVEENTDWSVCDTDSALHFCAIGYYVAKILNKNTDIPIGVISANKGAAKIEAFIPEGAFEKKELKSYMESYNAAKLPDSDADEIFDKAYKEDLVWMDNNGVTMEDMVKSMGVEATTVKGIRRPRKEVEQVYKYHRDAPGMYYKRFIDEQIAPMAVKGVLWYQGESNRESENYAEMFRIMAESWRNALKNDKLPFYTIEIAPYLYQEEKLYTSKLRMEQWRAAKITPNTHIMSTQDLGDEFDIHPNHKAEVGIRLANQILNYSYGIENYCDNPSYKDFEIKDGKIFIELYNDDGFFGVDYAGNMEICGEDNEYRSAELKYEDGRLIVWSDDIKKPKNVRYCYKAYFKKGYLYNKAGLPLAPFTTDITNIRK